MTGDSRKELEALDRLADALVDDIIETPDEIVLDEIAEDHGDVDKLAADMRALFERTIQEVGKSKLAAAKQAATNAREMGPSVVNIDRTEARRLYDDMVANDEELNRKLTMAARRGEGQSEHDKMNTIEDLAELGAFDDAENEGN